MSDIESAEPDDRYVREVRGASLMLFRRDLRMAAGEVEWAAILRDCGPEARAFLSRDPDPHEWVPIEWLSEARAAFSKHSRKNPWANRGEMMARHIITHAKASGLLKEEGPEGAVRGYPAVFAYLHRGGRAEVARVAPGAAEIVVHVDYPYTEYPAEFLPRFFMAFLKLHGGRLVTVDYQAPGVGAIDHRYAMTWK